MASFWSEISVLAIGKIGKHGWLPCEELVAIKNLAPL